MLAHFQLSWHRDISKKKLKFKIILLLTAILERKKMTVISYFPAFIQYLKFIETRFPYAIFDITVNNCKASVLDAFFKAVKKN
jgi:hypothetical protein